MAQSTLAVKYVAVAQLNRDLKYVKTEAQKLLEDAKEAQIRAGRILAILRKYGGGWPPKL